jgi:cell division protein FtsB
MSEKIKTPQITEVQECKKIKDEEVMISTSISDLEKMLESVEEHADKRTDSKFEKFFMPAILLFGLIACAGFWIIYSITTDMTQLAKSMDPKMGGNMSAMVKSIDELSKNVGKMNRSVALMQQDFSNVNQNMIVLVRKMDKMNNLDKISTDMSEINQKMSTLQPMLLNMQDMNKNMIGMQKSMLWMQKDISTLRASFAKPMSIFNSVPFL